MFCLSILLSILAIVVLSQGVTALTLDQTSVGRFGAGKKVTPNIATQNLLVWHVRNTGRRIDVSLYDHKTNTLSLGECGFPLSDEQSPQNSVRDISWTGLTNRYELDNTTLDISESLLTPALWFHTTGNRLALFHGSAKSTVSLIAAPAVTGMTANNVKQGMEFSTKQSLAKPWFLLVVGTKVNRFPVLCLTTHEPTRIVQEDGGITVEWSAGTTGNELGILPLYGCRPDVTPRVDSWQQGIPDEVTQRADILAMRFMYLPTGMKETYRVTDQEVEITDTITSRPIIDDWGWYKRTKGFVLIPPALANARHYGYPVSYRQQIVNLDYSLFLSSLSFAPDTSKLTFSLPRPRIHETLLTPVFDSSLTKFFPKETLQTIQDYNDYVIQTYSGPRYQAYEGSAIGEARALAAEYPNSLLMNKKAQQVFRDWADWAIREKLYNRKACYDVRSEAINNRRFLLDNYRFGGDYIDAGWFGYDLMAMWARAHYGDKWSEVQKHWQLIKQLFYGWTWTYTDYATMYDPLGFNAEVGGDKIYGDNMATLAGHYACTRMAYHLGDREMLQDGLYVLSRDLVARFNRMNVYAYTRSCGFDVEVNAMVSDMWDGPNAPFTSDYTPPDSRRWRVGDIVDYGEYGRGLWYFTGSFLEPVTPATIALIQTAKMKERVAETQRIIEKRYPRWYAAPDWGEIANYQIYLRGALFHESPVKLRYYFDYENAFGHGTWMANAWHANAFSGIILSSFYGLEYQNGYSIHIKRGKKWLPAADAVEVNVLRGQEPQPVLILLNMTPSPLQAAIKFDLSRFGVALKPTVCDLKRKVTISQDTTGKYRIILSPGVNTFALGKRVTPSTALEIDAPKVLAVTTYSKHVFDIKLRNNNRVSQTLSLSAKALAIPENARNPFVLQPGQKISIPCSYTAPSRSTVPFRVGFTIRTNNQEIKRQIEICLLPALITILETNAPGIVRGPEIGTIHAIIHSRSNRNEQVIVRCQLDGKSIASVPLTIQSHTRQLVDIPLKTDAASGVYTLSVLVSGERMETQRWSQKVVYFSQPLAGKTEAVTLYTFNRDTEGWQMPDWPNGNRDPNGVLYKPKQVGYPTATDENNKSALYVPVNLVSGKPSQAFVGTAPGTDWSLIDAISVDVYLPKDAPQGLDATLYFMGNGWQWMLQKKDYILRPGEWTRIEAPLAGFQTDDAWDKTEQEIKAALTNVIEFGVRISNGKDGSSAYLGPVYLTRFRVQVNAE